MAEMNTNGLFREKSLERISSPEQLDDYIRVVSPAIWLLLIGVVLLLAGVLVWASVGSIPVTNAEGVTEFIHPIKYLLN